MAHTALINDLKDLINELKEYEEATQDQLQLIGMQTARGKLEGVMLEHGIEIPKTLIHQQGA